MTELTTPEPTAVDLAQAKLDGALETHRAIVADQEAFQLAQRAAAREIDDKARAAYQEVCRAREEFSKAQHCQTMCAHEMLCSANYFTGCERKKKPNSNFCGVHRRDHERETS
jgi:hypothetical protein